jgi:XTP/dITP diphosphohydrolase
MKLLLATRNAHKTQEISHMLSGLGLEILYAQNLPGLVEVVEDGKTLEENACKKARTLAMVSGLWALADDTGLEVEALHGAPGVLSARYAGPRCDYAANNAKLLRELLGLSLPQRKAVFRCVLALCSPTGDIRLREGRLSGLIAEKLVGTNGFGYDPIFLLPKLGKTLAELDLEEKNRLSHRARAIQAIRPDLESLITLPQS